METLMAQQEQAAWSDTSLDQAQRQASLLKTAIRQERSLELALLNTGRLTDALESSILEQTFMTAIRPMLRERMARAEALKAMPLHSRLAAQQLN
jgi:hypothetical protein